MNHLHTTHPALPTDARVRAVLHALSALLVGSVGCANPEVHPGDVGAPVARVAPPPAPVVADAAAVAPDAGPAYSAVCSDPGQWTPDPPPRACPDSAPWTASGTPSVRLRVDASARGKPWSRFYEKAVAADHANTLRCTAWGRNAQSALKKGHEEAGFQYVRFHGILSDDIGVYSEDASGAPKYDWSRLDEVYDAIIAASMRPIVEISFMPSALASPTGKVQTILWYNGRSPNISPPKDWGRWQDFMAAIVRHLEQRYGEDEVRKNWYFEVWNEPSWMYSLGDQGYPELYLHTATGLLQGDPEIRVGGPAGSSDESPTLIPALLAAAKASQVKVDFITYHCYGDDHHTSMADANTLYDLQQKLSQLLKENHFTGELINDEFGASSRADPCRDDECSASFIAKTIHLIGTDAHGPPPSAYGYWAVSDLYEEFDTGPALAYRGGNYGLLLKGDPRFPDSFDLAKPAFNVFRLLHRMGDTQLSVTGGTTADGVNAAATTAADGTSLQVLVYNHVKGEKTDGTHSSLVSLTVDHLPFATGSVRVRHFIVDRTHANSHTAWVGLNKPEMPTREQWALLRDASKLCFYEEVVAARGHALTLTFPANVYGVSLIELAPAAR